LTEQVATSPAPVSAEPSIDPELREEIHRRVGRNLLQLQKIERAWKHLLLTCVVEGAVADGAAGAARWSSTVLRMNLGDVAKALLNEVLTAEPKERPIKGDKTKGTVRTRLTFEAPPEETQAAEAMRARWKELVDARNQLVHHFIERWQRASPEELKGALAELDDQHACAETVLTETLPLLTAAAAQREALARQWQSESGQREMLVGLTLTNVMDRLCTVAASKSRSDGWTYETTASAALRREDPEGVRLISEELGVDWLPRLLRESTSVFEVTDEPVPNGAPTARRRLYRLRDDLGADTLMVVSANT
jgi:hypothetical protein